MEHPARTDNSMQQILRQFGNQENWMITDGALIGRIHLEPTLDISGKTPSVSLRIGDKKNVCRKKYSGIGAACTTDRDA